MGDFHGDFTLCARDLFGSAHRPRGNDGPDEADFAVSAVTGCDTNAIEAGSDTDYNVSKLACSDDVSIATARDFSRRGN